MTLLKVGNDYRFKFYNAHQLRHANPHQSSETFDSDFQAHKIIREEYDGQSAAEAIFRAGLPTNLGSMWNVESGGLPRKFLTVSSISA